MKHAIKVALTCAALLVGLLSPRAAFGQQIMGTVLDVETGGPISGMAVIVRVPEGSRIYRTLSDDAGRFRVRLDSAGTYVLAVSRIGYGAVDTTGVNVAPGQDLFVELRIPPEAVGISPLRVTVKGQNPYLEAKGFYERLERGLGKFMDPDRVKSYPSTWPTHVLRSLGVSLEDGRVKGCLLLIDGMHIDWDVSLDDLVSKDQMAAVEFHTLDVPIEFRRHNTPCAVAIWTTWGESLSGRSRQ